MKNIYKISAVLLVSLSIIMSSCKKEDEVVAEPIIINGCTDLTAMNYLSNANSDDGSCIFAYDLAIGIWNIDPDCEEYTIPVVGTTIALNDQMPETIDVQGNDDNSLFIDMNGTQVSGDIDNNGNITVPKQTVSIDMGLGPMDIDVQGDGKIESENSGYMDLTYEFEIPVIGGTEALDCQLTLTK